MKTKIELNKMGIDELVNMCEREGVALIITDGNVEKCVKEEKNGI